MIDMELIESFKELPARQAKNALVDYVQQFGITGLKKNKKFDDLLAEVKDQLNESEVVKEPTPKKRKKKKEPEVVEVEPPKPEPVVEEKVEVITSIPIDSEEIEIKPEKEKPVLSPKFRPAFNMLGSSKHTRYINIPYWIHDWIKSTPDWELKLEEYPNQHERKYMDTLVYFILKEGSIRVRETRNSRYDVLRFDK